MRKPITVLWCGGGQDSVALIHLLREISAVRARYVEADLLVVMADTGNEWPATVAYVRGLKTWCDRAGVEFYHLTPDMGFHNQGWQSLQGQMLRNDNIMALGLPRTCTDNLKIQVCYRFLDAYLGERYGYPSGRKQALYAYAAEFGKLRCILGFARGEERRCGQVVQPELFPDLVPDERPVWMKKTVEAIYPLIDLGLNRAGCQAAIRDAGHEVPPPSCCMMCPFQSERDVLLLARTQPATFRFWQAREAAKLAKFSDKPRNLGVKGSQTLGEFLARAEAMFGHFRTDELEAMRFANGHGVASKY